MLTDAVPPAPTTASPTPPRVPPPDPTAASHPVILFDGVCNLCNTAVQWVIRHDRKQRFRFASLQSEYARESLTAIAPGQALPDSVVLIVNGRVLTRSDAAIGIARRLGFPYLLSVLALVIPRPIRDAVYSWIARNRYRWFGRQNACMVPTPELRARFLDSCEPRPAATPQDARAMLPPPRTLTSALAESLRRIGMCYMILYILPFPLGAIPIGATWGSGYENAKQQLIARLSKGVGGPELTIFPAGSGDTTYNYIELLAYAALAVPLGLLWSAITRFRPVSLRLRDLFSVLLRFYLASVLIGYGWVKVFPLQMPAPAAHNSFTSYADSSPMGILWRFIGASPAYETFAGLGEVIGGALLLWRRTTPLGAVISSAVLLNVVMLNFCYDVPVKLFSSHLLLIAVVLMWPHLVRILSVLVLNLPAQPALLHPFPVRRRIFRWPLTLAKIALALLFLVSPGIASFYQRQAIVQAAAAPSLGGVYKVESFTRDNLEGRANEDADRWIRFGFSGFSGPAEILTIQHADISIRRFRTSVDMDAATIAVTVRPPQGQDQPAQTDTLTFTHPDPALLRIEGTLEGHTLLVLARKQDNDGLLMSRGFRWINEFPYNR